MNSEIKKILNVLNVKNSKILYYNKTIIIDDKYVIKEKISNIKKIYDDLISHGINNYLEIVYETEKYYVMEYIKDIEMKSEEKNLVLAKLMRIIHAKTVYYKNITENDYKDLYESITSKINNIYLFYSKLIDDIEKNIYFSPSEYLLARNISLIYSSINTAKIMIDKWLDIIKVKKRVRITKNHNNIQESHLLIDKKNKYLISWDKSSDDIPVFDLFIFYLNAYERTDFIEIMHIYEQQVPLTLEEKYLFMSLILIPSCVDLSQNELKRCDAIRKIINYLIQTNEFIRKYPTKQNV